LSKGDLGYDKYAIVARIYFIMKKRCWKNQKVQDFIKKISPMLCACRTFLFGSRLYDDSVDIFM